MQILFYSRKGSVSKSSGKPQYLGPKFNGNKLSHRQISFFDFFNVITFRALLLALSCQIVLREAISSLILIEVHHNDELIGVAIVSPRSKRFNFMCTDDVQIGGVYVAPKMRGLGIAKAVVEYTICNIDADNFWYLAANSNTASIRVAEANDFGLIGTGTSKPMLKLLPMIKSYELFKRV